MTDTLIDEIDNIFKKGWLVERYDGKIADWEKNLQLRIVYYDGETETYPYTATYSLVKESILSAINKARADEREKVLEEVLHQLELTVIFGDQAQQQGIIEPDWVGRLNKFIHYYRDQLNQLKEEG